MVVRRHDQSKTRCDSADFENMLNTGNDARAVEHDADPIDGDMCILLCLLVHIGAVCES